MNAILQRAAALLVRCVPGAFWRMLIRFIVGRLAQGDARQALPLLLNIESDLERRIDEAAIRYEGGLHPKHRLMAYHTFFVERLRPGEQVLDIGCGMGAVAYSLATQAQARVTGVDIDTRSIAYANQHFQHPNLTFVVGDALQMLPRGVYETIVFSNVLEHIEHRVAFLRSVQQQLQPRRWLIRVPMYNRHWSVPLRQELGLFFYSDVTHYTEYTQPAFEAEMQQAGLQIQCIQVNWGEIWAEVAAAPVAEPAEGQG